MKKIYSKFQLVKLMFLGIILVSACSNSTDYNRDNPNDPSSNSFVPKSPHDAISTAITIDKNTIQLEWSKIDFIERYQIFRRSDNQEAFNLIHEISNPNDTTYIDVTDNVDVYFYRIDAIASNGNSVSLETEKVLSGLVFKNDFSFDKFFLLDEDPGFIMPLSDEEFFVHHFSRIENWQVFSILNFSDNTWNPVEFSQLGSKFDDVRASSLYPIDKDRFLIINRFRQQQDFLGYICVIESQSCSVFGEGLKDAEGQLYSSRFENLDNGSILITLTAEVNFQFKLLALVLDPSTNKITTIDPPLGIWPPEDLIKLPNNDILACHIEDIGIRDVTRCQILDTHTLKWSYTSPGNLAIEEMPLDKLFMEVLEDGRVLILNIYSNAQIYNSVNDSWETVPSANYRNEYIWDTYQDILFKTSDNSILTVEIENNNGPYFIDIYDPASNLWGNTIELPPEIEYLYSIHEISIDKYLLTFHEKDTELPRSAIYYFK